MNKIRQLEQEYSMNKDYKAFLGEKEKKAVMDIVKKMISLTGTEDVYNIEGRAEICLNEFLANLWKYEDKTKFRIGCELHSGIIFIYFLFPGNDLDVESVKKRIKEIEENPHPRESGTGLFNCYKVSDKFEIKKTCDEDLGTEMVCAFLVRGMQQ